MALTADDAKVMVKKQMVEIEKNKIVEKEWMYLSQYGQVYVATSQKDPGDMRFEGAAPLMIHLIKEKIIDTNIMTIDAIRLEYHRVIHSMSSNDLENAMREAAAKYS